MDNHTFYINSQIDHFIKWGYLELSNEEILLEYENALRNKNISYKIVHSLGDYGIIISICTPEKYPEVIKRLDYEIERLERILAIKKSARGSKCIHCGNPMPKNEIRCKICHP